jgi:hypothetical protein
MGIIDYYGIEQINPFLTNTHSLFITLFKNLVSPIVVFVSLKYTLVLVSLFPFNTPVNLLSVNNTNNNKP